jgi:hypothetical protein
MPSSLHVHWVLRDGMTSIVKDSFVMIFFLLEKKEVLCFFSANKLNMSSIDGMLLRVTPDKHSNN